ncbi:Cleavage and polyadenylation specificity factor subunit A, putative [Penicillium digitatum PHI26]|uniref:Protein CFT1 n=2 Tax=Penicillium digitatum TaxID=36651 RepID=K9FC44_PEND2|nr:Cleavage and polyadenylation specificity factor subunit A, putative [Penicillium digitatum Pd1]EKV04111.1 Cleavage and polyadenylation specificity factor subunit A, putative [Penicillium digitatum Pd1]EKV05682.1 Cleavage and polyadenylation specificity factor subunit A, putative [Penicillium digitatum PHI26]
MQCYAELLPPTGVTHALAIPFTSATASNLIVIRTSLLQIFSLVKIVSSQLQKEGSEPHGSQFSQPETKLVLEKEYPLSGTVTDLSRVKILNNKSGGEAILIAVRNAKLSLIEWDPERHGISTISIHYYERDDLTRSPWVPDLSRCGSILSVDPSSRCAVYNFGIRNLAILPFHQAGDDLVMDDYDSELEGERPIQNSGGGAEPKKSKEGPAYQTPYCSSFVLPLTALDPSLLHPISLAFLYEYREPTFGILFSQVATSTALLYERKDVVFYAVFTLDLEQRASTTLLSVSRLPSDLFKVVALPLPVGGALLLGSNEIVHVDQAGKTNAVGVNEFSRQVSSFSMTDQSDLAFRLEGCVVERLGGDSGDLLLALASGDMALIKFKLDGRSVSGITIHLLPAHAGGDMLKSAASCSSCLGDGNVFIGSEDADSVLLEWSRSSASTKKARLESKQTADGFDDLEDDDDQMEDDDLYSSAPGSTQVDNRMGTENLTTEFYNFRLKDCLPSIGPLRDITLGKVFSNTYREKQATCEAVSAELELVASQGSDRGGGLVVIKREIDPLTTMSLKIDDADGVWSASVKKRRGASSTDNPSRQYVVVSRSTDSEQELNEVFVAEEQNLKPFRAPEFNPNEDCTVDIGSFAGDTRLVQVLRNEVRSYDMELGLSQIYPVWDEDTSDERVAVSASFIDPYLMIIRDDSSVLLLQADENGDLDEVPLSTLIISSRWRSGCLYYDNSQSFSVAGSLSKNSSEGEVLLFLLNPDYKLSIFRLSDMMLIAIIEGVDCLPPVLSTEPPKRSNTRETLTELIVANLGDSSSLSPYLISCIRACQLPSQTQFDYSWTLRKVPIEEQVNFLAYSTSSETYVLGTSRQGDFKLPEGDELHPEWRNEELSFCPKIPESSIKVVSPKTWTIIDSYPLDPDEQVTAVKNVNIEVSENTHERMDLIVVGTAIAKGEDMPARGTIYVFDVIKVAPDPERPETGRKLKLIGKETVKGAVTALSGIGGQGFIIVAQGQKCMVRGLKEDGSLLPVAFMDMQCYVNVVKELKGTGMVILGDAVKGLWFAGYSEEPYRMTLFGKDPEYLEVVAADFLPDGNKLYMLVADSDCNLHVLQYDPEDPKSSNGDRLLSRSKFYTGNFASSVTLLPRTAVSSELTESSEEAMDVDETFAKYQVLIASQNGSLALVTSVAEESYRRLSGLQSQLINTVDHPAGLNARAFRATESDGAAGRGMVDGNLLRLWLNMGKQRQAEIAGRVGATEWEIKADLETIGGDGLGYL